MSDESGCLTTSTRWGWSERPWRPRVRWQSSMPAFRSCPV